MLVNLKSKLFLVKGFERLNKIKIIKDHQIQLEKILKRKNNARINKIENI